MKAKISLCLGLLLFASPLFAGDFNFDEDLESLKAWNKANKPEIVRTLAAQVKAAKQNTEARKRAEKLAEDLKRVRAGGLFYPDLQEVGLRIGTVRAEIRSKLPDGYLATIHRSELYQSSPTSGGVFVGIDDPVHLITRKKDLTTVQDLIWHIKAKDNNILVLEEFEPDK